MLVRCARQLVHLDGLLNDGVLQQCVNFLAEHAHPLAAPYLACRSDAGFR